MKLLLLALFTQSAFALDANVHLSINQGVLDVRYEFSEEVQGFLFTYSLETNRNDIFENYPVDSGELISVNERNLVLRTFPLQNVSLLTKKGTIISQDTEDTLILTDLTETYRAVNKEGNEEYIANLNYYFDGKLIHTRDLYRGETWQRYLLLKRSSNLIQSNYGDLIIDTDMPHREMFIEEIQKTLKFFYEKLGHPYSKPTVFFTYNSGQTEPWWYDGRVIIGSPYVKISLGGELNLEEARGKIILYHAIISHEIAHHWNARNLDGDSSSWIYEGGAEYLATIVSKALFSNQMMNHVDYMEKSNIKSCQRYDEETDFAYHCGHMIFKLAIENSSKDPFEIFKGLHSLPVQNKKNVLEVFEKYTSSEVMEEIYKIIDREKE